ncbi:MAG TPA: hypothetical protein VME20_12685 [Acidimicrobiales bacterium]|nr:hypothetical protein [Acidimicrobiales bacterium]
MAPANSKPTAFALALPMTFAAQARRCCAWRVLRAFFVPVDLTGTAYSLEMYWCLCRRKAHHPGDFRRACRYATDNGVGLLYRATDFVTVEERIEPSLLPAAHGGA